MTTPHDEPAAGHDRDRAALTVRRIASCVGLAIAVIALHPHAQAPAPQPRFRGGTDLVQVDVSVLDKKRHPVRGLTAADFTVLEDGQPREIQAFSEVYLPERLRAEAAPWVRDVPGDVATNQGAEDQGRLVIILLDRSIPAGDAIRTAKRSAIAAVNELGPDDLAAVVSTGNGMTQNLTSNRARLLRAIDAVDQSYAISDEAVAAMAAVQVVLDPLSDGRCLCGLCVLETITRVADAVQNTPRRRKILFFIGSDLFLQTPSRPGVADVGCDNRLADARTAMLAAVDRANLTVHSIDPSGLGTTAIANAALPVRTSNTMQTLQRQGAISVLPARTGGRTVINANDPDRQMSSIFRESDTYYLIGFRPGDANANGRFHAITVKTSRQGLDVRARSGYTAAPGPRTAPPAGTALAGPLRAALTGLLPTSGVPLDLNAASFATPGSNKSAVVLTLNGDAFATAGAESASAEATPDNSAVAPIDVVAGAFDRGGRSIGVARQTLQLEWPARVPDSAPTSLAPERRVNLLSKLDLPPGEYEIRVGVSGGEPAHTASVFAYVTVPAFNNTPLSLSSVVLGATAGTLTAPRDFVATLLPIVPTAQREFARTDRFLGFLRVYQGTSRRDPLLPVRLRSSVLDAKGDVVATEAAVLAAAQFEKERTAEHYISLPLAGLASGEYLLRIEAEMGTYSAGRAVRFSVR
jgi:VWFA-related protein